MRALFAVTTLLGIGVFASPSCSNVAAFGWRESLGLAWAASRVDSLGAGGLTPANRIAREDPALLGPNPHGVTAPARPEPADRAPQPVATPVRDPPAAEQGEPLRDAPVLVATAKETVVYARPSFKAPKIGYLRAGAVVSRSERPLGGDGCPNGFYEIAPEGFVCAGRAASIDPETELARAAKRRADRTAPLPYVYGMATSAGAPLYSRIPTDAEQRNAEPDLAWRLVRGGGDRSFDGAAFDDVPSFLEHGAPSIGTSGRRFPGEKLELGRAIAKTGFAFLGLFESGNRRFGLTVDMSIVPLDRFVRVEPSRFHGLPLGETDSLPVVFVRAKSAALYAGDPRTTGLRFERRLEFREALSLSGAHAEADGVRYLETRDGKWLVDQSLLRVDPPTSLPGWAEGDRTWIDVSILHQTLVAYEGKKPVFVTLVSTGADGTGDPETTHSTIQGQFLIHTKFVTATMDNDEVGDAFDLRDVPYVQYFKDGFALHAAYWHDGFGAPRSHGCVNLSPLDARYLFAWTEPHVPAAWHGATGTRGTLVSIRP